MKQESSDVKNEPKLSLEASTIKTRKFIEWKVAKSYRPIILEINKACCGLYGEILDQDEEQNRV